MEKNFMRPRRKAEHNVQQLFIKEQELHEIKKKGRTDHCLSKHNNFMRPRRKAEQNVQQLFIKLSEQWQGMGDYASKVLNFYAEPPDSDIFYVRLLWSLVIQLLWKVIDVAIGLSDQMSHSSSVCFVDSRYFKKTEKKTVHWTLRLGRGRNWTTKQWRHTWTWTWTRVFAIHGRIEAVVGVYVTRSHLVALISLIVEEPRHCLTAGAARRIRPGKASWVLSMGRCQPTRISLTKVITSILLFHRLISSM